MRAESVRNVSNSERTESRRTSWVARLNPLKAQAIPPAPSYRQPSREPPAGFLSTVLFSWLTPLLKVGYHRPLELNDIWLVNPRRRTAVLETRFSTSLQSFVDRRSKAPLLFALFTTFKRDLVIGAFCQALGTIALVILPLVLKYLIAFATDAFNASKAGSPGPSLGYGIGLVIILTVVQIVISVATNHSAYLGMTVGGEAHAVLMSTIFEKALKLSERAKAGGLAIPPNYIAPGSEEEKERHEKRSSWDEKDKTKNKLPTESEIIDGWSNGRIINLMSTDTSRIDQASGMLHMLWAAPLSIAITLALLLINLSYSALPGLGVLFIFLPVLSLVIKALFKRRSDINKITDQRVGLTQEILTVIRFVKYFGWESSFQNRIDAIRKQELRSIRILLATRDGINAIALTIPVLASMFSFITFALTSNIFDPAPIFSSLALFNGLRLPLNMFPVALGQVTDAYASVKRIEKFLLAEEATDDSQFDKSINEAVVLRNATFTWEQVQSSDKNCDDGPAEISSIPEPFQIHDLTLTLGRAELVAVIGGVGSGKSSFLAALAGEMRKTAGTVTFGASRAFCAQDAWIQNASMQDNIVFGNTFNATRYAQVTEACALLQDFQMLPDGDRTEIGERGINISGGQKQRVSIARAIYFDSDIVLMDDPLSSVDARVGQEIMDQAICGLLADKCRIMATHQLHLLPRCDRIIWLEDGRIRSQGPYSELMANNPDFAEIMKLTVIDKPQDGDEEIDTVDENDAAERVMPTSNTGALMQVEDRAVRAISWGVYRAYIETTGSLLVAPLVIILLVLSQGSNLITGIWLSWWTAKKFALSNRAWIGIYAGLGGSQAFLMFIFAVSLTIFGTKASEIMFKRAMTRVLRAPISFFDTTPLGRITNRFSKDIDVMDNVLSDSIRLYLMAVGSLLGTAALIVAYFYYFIAAVIPLVLIILFSGSYYRSSAREIKRHEAVLRSHVFSRFSEAVYGATTIRAYGIESRFSGVLRDAIDSFNGAYFLTFANQRWISIRLNAIGVVLIFILGILVVTSRFLVDPAISGLALSYMHGITASLQFLVRQMAEVENDMNNTERLHYYATQIEQEAPSEIGNVADNWPARGEIVFNRVQMCYRKGLPLVLRNFNLHVLPGERLGIIGRTGAGKSSIINTLFRLVELSGGSITIDGIDISTIGLRQLRSRLTIIPQDPTLFKGTVRSNLDPFSEHTDADLWLALRQAGLGHSHERSVAIGLDTIVREEGLNLSLGQRQLLALARALVCDAKIIICDEATSSIDLATDQKVQRTLESFRSKTLLCIAHRLWTVIGYDRICVMDHGEVAEIGTPLELFDQGGIFRSLCGKAGVTRAEIVKKKEQQIHE
ncbi:ABC multidrug transporter [Truncatella angustata]|uniref:ABC multidrug transporter n=1 Tax=Truncatella angustata TaxID=152316 RepID=A0A9P8RFH0_9PEZI|nr:ABC multidrug transporter [Truncatella angustata]KAH6645053.1 ABC multidrug transporter [Truncatella angustata]